jgi:hypothetical protein
MDRQHKGKLISDETKYAVMAYFFGTAIALSLPVYAVATVGLLLLLNNPKLFRQSN